MEVLSRLRRALNKPAAQWRKTIRYLLPVTCLLLSACSKPPPVYQEQGYVFGTLVEVSVYGEPQAQAKRAVKAVMEEFQRLHNELHAWKPSPLSRLNAAFAADKSKKVSPELAAILKDATQLSVQSHGLFDPAIGRLIKLWGFEADKFKAVLPAPAKVKALVADNPQMTDITIRNGVASSRNRAVRVDLGGYAKGYALDRAAQILKKMNVHNALINIGGNVMALGRHGDRAWRVGIQHPRKPGPFATVKLRDGEAIGTSGDYQRYFMVDGKRYCHLIDPRTGRPKQGVEAVTILTHGVRAGVRSDADSKPLFISGVKGWRRAAREMKLADALLIDGSGVVHLTPAMQKRLKFTDKSMSEEVEP